MPSLSRGSVRVPASQPLQTGSRLCGLARMIGEVLRGRLGRVYDAAPLERFRRSVNCSLDHSGRIAGHPREEASLVRCGLLGGTSAGHDSPRKGRVNMLHESLARRYGSAEFISAVSRPDPNPATEYT